MTIGNIHIRYEDDVAHPGHPFAVGFTLRGLDAHTTDEHWQPTYVPGMPIKVHKLASLDSLSLYWNPVRGNVKDFGEAAMYRPQTGSEWGPSHVIPLFSIHI